jgi:hypothetical protein
MNVSTLWATTAVVSGAVVAVGKFFDDYHVRNSTKSRARDRLIAAFLWLDNRTIPDVGRAMASRALRLAQRIGCRKPLLVLVALILAASSWMSRSYWNVRFWFVSTFVVNCGYVVLLLLPAVVLALILLLVTIKLLRFLSGARHDAVALTISLVGPLIVTATGLLTFGIVYWIAPYVMYWFAIDFVTFEILAAAVVVIALALTYLFWSLYVLIVLVKLLIALLRRAAMAVLDASSDPKHSPFAYSAALLSIVTIFITAAIQLFGAISHM